MAVYEKYHCTPLSRAVVTYCLAQVNPTKKKVLVKSQEILLQAYLAEWPPKPVTNPVLLIHRHTCQPSFCK